MPVLHRNDKVLPSNNDFPPTPPPIYKIADPELAVNDVGMRDRKRTITVTEQGELVREQGITYMATLLNFLKSLIGAGYLSLPLAFKNAGLMTTFLLIVLFAFLNRFCMAQLVHCAQHHYRRLGICFLNYGDMASKTLASSFEWVRPYKKVAKYIVNVTILFLQFGFCSTYYLFIAVSLKQISEELTPFRATTFQWLLIIYVPMSLLNFLRTLRFLAILSTIGNIFIVCSLIFILQHVILHPQHRASELPWYNNFDGILTASGAIIYSFEAQTLVLPMENKLKRPGQMLGPFGILSTGIFLSSMVYSSVGFFGYVAYGDAVKGSITLNLPQNLTFTLVKLAVCISIFGSFLLQMYVIVEMLWAKIAPKMVIFEEEEKEYNQDEKISQTTNSSVCPLVPMKFKLGCELVFRTLLVTVCFLFAAAVPNLERIIPLVGITSGMLLSFVFPALLDLLVFVPIHLKEGKRWRASLRMLQNLLLACVGLFGMFAGLKANFTEMMSSNHDSADLNFNSTTTHH